MSGFTPHRTGARVLTRRNPDTSRPARTPRGLAIQVLCLLTLFVLAQTALAEPVRLGAPKQPTGALVHIALDQGYFKAEGLDLAIQEYPSGKRALLEGLFQGKADVISSADVPVAFNFFKRTDYRVVAAMALQDNVNRIIARRDSGISAPSDLKGKRIATQRASAVHFFMHLFLSKHALHEGLETSFMKAEKLPMAIAENRIDAFSMREPYISRARTALGSNAIVFAEPGLYPQFELLVMSEAFLEKSPDAARAMLRALKKAEAFARANPDRAVAICARQIGADQAALAQIWPQFNLSITLDQDLLIGLEDIAAWAMEEGLLEAPAIPNMLELIDTRPLHEVDPGSVNIIH
ncbi:MAG: ABC transporter substrate-binding protein [Gammaproteobacteria bacterium]